MVHVHDADLVAPGFIRAGCRRVEPAPRQLAVAVVVSHRLALEPAGVVAVFAANHQARMHAVAIHDAEVGIQRAVGGPHIRDGRARQFVSGQAVEDGKILCRVIRPGDGCAVGQNHAARRAHTDFRATIAVQIVNRHVVLVADADGRRARLNVVLVHAVGTHVHLPEKSAVALVGLKILVGRHDGGLAVHHIIIFPIAVQITNPAKFHVIRRCAAARHRMQRPRQILAHRRIRREAERRARRAFHAVGHWHDIPGV